jgi:hypothetical protein
MPMVVRSGSLLHRRSGKRRATPGDGRPRAAVRNALAARPRAEPFSTRLVRVAYGVASPFRFAQWRTSQARSYPLRTGSQPQATWAGLRGARGCGVGVTLGEFTWGVPPKGRARIQRPQPGTSEELLTRCDISGARCDIQAFVPTTRSPCSSSRQLRQTSSGRTRSLCPVWCGRAGAGCGLTAAGSSITGRNMTFSRATRSCRRAVWSRA